MKRKSNKNWHANILNELDSMENKFLEKSLLSMSKKYPILHQGYVEILKEYHEVNVNGFDNEKKRVKIYEIMEKLEVLKSSAESAGMAKQNWYFR